MRVKIVKKNLFHDFQEKFDILFLDPDFGFKADDRLITKVISSLQYEHYNQDEILIPINEISNGIYLVQEGNIDVSYKDHDIKFLQFDAGCYIGDTSYIFRTLNQYCYKVRQSSQSGLLVYSIQDRYLSQIFAEFPRFESILKIRALRRHHYQRKLKNQQVKIYKYKKGITLTKIFRESCGDDKKQMDEMDKLLEGLKKVRLVEE